MKYFRCKNCNFLVPITDDDYVQNGKSLYAVLVKMYPKRCCDHPIYSEEK